MPVTNTRAHSARTRTCIPLAHDPQAGLSLMGRKKRKAFVTQTETNVHGDTLYFMVKGPSLLQRMAVGGGWRRLLVGGG